MHNTLKPKIEPKIDKVITASTRLELAMKRLYRSAVDIVISQPDHQARYDTYQAILDMLDGDELKQNFIREYGENPAAGLTLTQAANWLGFERIEKTGRADRLRVLRLTKGAKHSGPARAEEDRPLEQHPASTGKPILVTSESVWDLRLRLNKLGNKQKFITFDEAKEQTGLSTYALNKYLKRGVDTDDSRIDSRIYVKTSAVKRIKEQLSEQAEQAEQH